MSTFDLKKAKSCGVVQMRSQITNDAGGEVQMILVEE